MLRAIFLIAFFTAADISRPAIDCRA